MTEPTQQFLNDLDKRLWTMADQLRSNLDAAVYKHAVLGLIFLKYVSDAFDERRQEIRQQLTDPNDEYFIDPADFDSTAEYDAFIADELEERDYYTEKNVFWVPALARWQLLQNSAKLPPGTTITVNPATGEEYEIRSIGRLIDDALGAIEQDNPKLKNVLNKTYTQLQIAPDNLSSLIDLIATIPFSHEELGAKDILGHVYEYFLGEFAQAEGKKGGQYFTPKSIVSLIVEMIEPYQGRVYDPAMGSGGFFVQSERFIEADADTDRKRRFLDNMAALTKAYSLCSTLDEAMALRKEIAFFSAVKAAIVKYTTVEQKRTEEERDSALKQILDNAIVADGVVDIYDLAGIEQSNIGLLSDEFLDDVRNMPQRNVAVELLERLLRDEIRTNTRTNVIQEKKYTDRLLETLRLYHNRGIETAQVIEELIAMAKEFEEELQQGRRSGLTPDELAFYMALIQNESAVRKLGDNQLRELAKELTEKLRRSTTVDWNVRESVRARIRNIIRQLLRRYKYPPDGQRAAIDLVIQQAEALSESWSTVT